MSTTPERSLLEQGKSSKFLFTFLISFTLAKMIGLAFTKIFTNVLSQDEMGFYAIIFSATGLVMSFASFGIPTALNRYAIRYKIKNQLKELKDFIFSGIVIFLIAELLIIGGILISYFVTNKMIWFFQIEQYVISLLLIAGIVIAQLFSTLCYTIATSLHNSRYYAVVIIMRVLFQIPFGLLFVVIFDWGVFGLIASLAVSEIAVALYSVYVLIRDIGIGRFSFTELKKIFEFSFPVYLNGILWYVFDLGILLFVDYIYPLTGTNSVALYRYGALTIVNLILVAGRVFRMVYSPLVYRHFDKKEYQKVEDLTIQISKLFLIFFFPLSMLLFSFSPLLIPFFTKAEYLTSLPVIPILLVAVLLQYLENIVSYGHVLYFKNYWNLIVGVISFALAALVAYFVVPFNGLLGIGIAYLVRRFITLAALFAVSQRYFKVHYPKTTLMLILSIMLVSSGIGVVFHFYVFNFLLSTYNILISFSISTVLFCGLILLFKILTKKDIKFLSDIFRSYVKGISIPKRDK